MNITVMVDMEGISGICRPSQVMSDGAHYKVACRYMAWDVNACVAGCIEGGALRILVRDAHGSGFNMPWEELDPRAEYVFGTSRRERIPGLDSCDGLILLGYHAMAGTPWAVLEHTMSSRHWQNFWLNGRKAGEVAIDSAQAAEHGVPTIMVSGDDKLCREARRLLPGVVAVQVKRGLDVEGAVMLPKELAHQRIREGAARAVRAAPKMKPIKVRHPVTLRLELIERGSVPLPARSGARVIDGRTYEVTGRTVAEALQRL